MRGFLKYLWLLLWGWMVCGMSFCVWAQQPPEADPNAPPADQQEATGAVPGVGESFWRLSILTEVNSMRFNDPHPYKQLAGDKSFELPAAKLNMGFDFTSKVKGYKPSGLSAYLAPLPPFSLEFVMPIDYYISGISFMYYHTTTHDFDALVGKNANVSPKSRIPLLKMKSYYDFFAFSVHPLTDPSAGGLDLYVGLGFARISGGYEAGFRGRPETDYKRVTITTPFEAFPVSFKRIGLDINGDLLGFRFSILSINKDPVIKKNGFKRTALRELQEEILPDAGEGANFGGVMLVAGMTIRL